MAGPVFSRIAERVMAGSLKRGLNEAIDSTAITIPDVKNGNLNEARYILDKLDIDMEWEGEYDKDNAYGKAGIITNGVQLTRSEINGDRVPNVRGMGAKDAVYLMENCGLRVQLSGVGKVHTQSIPAGNRAIKGQTVRLMLR